MKQTAVAENSQKYTRFWIAFENNIQEQIDVTREGLAINGDDYVVDLQAQRARPAHRADISNGEHTVLQSFCCIRSLESIDWAPHGANPGRTSSEYAAGKPCVTWQFVAGRPVERSAFLMRMIISPSHKSEK